MDDRISEFPIPILHHILCFLSQKEAVRTCLLSKQWRHIGTTRPNLDFSKEWFDDTQEKFVFIIDRTLQGYRDQNLSVHQLCLKFSRPNSRPVVSLVDKWIPIIAPLNIKAFKLEFLSYTAPYYNLPSAVFLAESLEELHLNKCKCRLSPVESVRFKSLRTLTLEQVQVDDGTLENILSGCPLLRRLVINDCWKLRNVRLSEAPGLKHFELYDCIKMKVGGIKIDVPNFEMVRIRGPWIWSHRRSAFLFSRLTSLHLCNAILSSESIDLLSFGCPTLENLALDNCSGFEEFHLASDSVKRLSISTNIISLKGVTISAPNILNFMIIAPQVLDTFSFTTTTSKEWDSNVILYLCENDPDFNVNSWFLKLRRMLEPLSGSRIDLILQMDMPCGSLDGSGLLSDEPPVVVENFEFGNMNWRTESWYWDFTNDLFRVCRPRHVWDSRPMSKSEVARYRRLSEFQFNILLASMSLGTFWRHDLEQVHVKTVNGKIWQLVEWTDLSELRNRMYRGVVCVKLKWRGQNCETGSMDGPFRFSFRRTFPVFFHSN